MMGIFSGEGATLQPCLLLRGSSGECLDTDPNSALLYGASCRRVIRINASVIRVKARTDVSNRGSTFIALTILERCGGTTEVKFVDLQNAVDRLSLRRGSDTFVHANDDTRCWGESSAPTTSARSTQPAVMNQRN